MVIVVIMRIGKNESDEVGIPGFRRGKHWMMTTALFGCFSVFIFLLAFVSASNPSTLASAASTPTEVTYIKKGFTAADQWDSDAQVDGLKVRLKLYSKNDLIIKEDGTLEVVLYEKLFDDDGNPLKGNELDRWTVKVTKEDYDAGELIKKLEYHKPVAADFGWVEVTFTAEDGSRYQTYDDIVYLKI